MKEKIAFWYKHKMWTLEMVKNAVKKSVITEEEYADITGKTYVMEG